MLPGFEPGFREYDERIKIPSDNHYTIAPLYGLALDSLTVSDPRLHRQRKRNYPMIGSFSPSTTIPLPMQSSYGLPQRHRLLFALEGLGLGIKCDMHTRMESNSRNPVPGNNPGYARRQPERGSIPPMYLRRSVELFKIGSLYVAASCSGALICTIYPL